MPKRRDLRSICLIGSGPIVIGQACEFDYAGSQALKVLRAEGFRTIVVNSNPATIMTDPGFADRTYVEPLDLESVAAVLRRERPDALLPTLGGQTALNLASELFAAGILDELAVELIGAGFKGMLDDGLSASFVPYTVLLPDHPLLTGPERVPVSAEGTIGDRSLNGRGGASGYEFDASPHHSGLADAPVEGIETLATATPQANLEWLGDPRHGADLLYWKRPAGGQVLSFGSIAVSGCLPVDEGIATLTRNALALFGVARREGTA